MRYLLVLAFCASILGCETTKKEIPPNTFQTISLNGDSLFIPVKSSEAEQRLMDNLKTAQESFEESPSELNYIWLGRRWAYLGDYLKAIEVYSEGLNEYPNSYKLFRHRAHRLVSLRKFDQAIADFKQAYELMPKDKLDTEPDGIPNRLNQPLSNTQFNILYHWGLAHYLKGEFNEAIKIYQECMDYSKNDDLITATADWLYMSQRRAGQVEAANKTLDLINTEMNIIENSSYHKRLLMYKGELPLDSLFSTNDADAELSLITQGYGVGNWYLYNGDTTQAKNIYLDVVANESWSPFGYIAAERDLSILR